jgi:formylglycine-generating enzyme required for sulfatase activity
MTKSDAQLQRFAGLVDYFFSVLWHKKQTKSLNPSGLQGRRDCHTLCGGASAPGNGNRMTVAEHRQRTHRRVCALLTIAACLWLNPALATERLALVIGNSDYSKSPLQNPENDAQDMANKLESHGFQVTKLINENQRTMVREIRRFTQQLDQDTVGLFYFAGHGVQVDGQNYLVPVDAEIEAEEDVHYEAVHLGRIIDGMRNGRGRLNLVILDACRNNPYSRSFRSAQRGLARTSPATGTMIMYATEPGNVAADGSDRNGIFTGALLEAIDEDPGAGIETLFKRTSVKVNKVTNGSQAPWSEGIIYGDFSFAEESAAEEPEPQVPVEPVAQESSPSAPRSEPVVGPVAEMPSSNLDAMMWQTAERYGDLAAYKAYAEAFPNGVFIRMAELAIKRLEAEQQQNEQQEAQLAEQQRQKLAEQQRLAEEKQRREQEEQQRLAEQERLKKQELQRLADEKRRQEEAERLAREKAEQLAAEQKAEKERLAAKLNEEKQNSIEQSIKQESARLADEQVRISELRTRELSIGIKPDDRVRIQMALNDMDINIGTADGRWGPRTRAGIKQWQANKGYEETGYLDDLSYKILLAEMPDNLQPAKEVFAYEPEMVIIPGGTFTMGANSGPGNQKPARDVRIESFELSKFEITFDQYEAFARSARAPSPDDRAWGRGSRPVINVTWEDAKAYVAWLSRQTGKAYRLPSEAEWEYAARAGSKTRYSFGDDSKQLCQYANSENVSCDGFKFTAPVGKFRPNAFGLYDMHGNVGEWVEDCWHPNYRGAPTTGRAWIEDGRCGTRVLRGGAWSNSASSLRATSRTGYTVITRLSSGGFRVARTLGQ